MRHWTDDDHECDAALPCGSCRGRECYVDDELIEAFEKLTETKAKRARARTEAFPRPVRNLATGTFPVHACTEEEYELRLVQQDHTCPICVRKFPRYVEITRQGVRTKRKALVVDHDHQTGETRGLLCNACNQGIGQLGDDIENLERAAAYLKRAGRLARRRAS